MGNKMNILNKGRYFFIKIIKLDLEFENKLIYRIFFPSKKNNLKYRVTFFLRALILN